MYAATDRTQICYRALLKRVPTLRVRAVLSNARLTSSLEEPRAELFPASVNSWVSRSKKLRCVGAGGGGTRPVRSSAFARGCWPCELSTPSYHALSLRWCRGQRWQISAMVSLSYRRTRVISLRLCLPAASPSHEPAPAHTRDTQSRQCLSAPTGRWE